MYYNKNDFRSYLEGDSLTHYGVLGMKWGHRKYDRIPGYSQKQTDRMTKSAEIGSLFGGLPGAAIATYATKHKIDKEKSNKVPHSKKKKTTKQYKDVKKKKKTPNATKNPTVAVVTNQQAKRMGLNDSTRITGTQEQEYWKNIAKMYEDDPRYRRR